MDGLDVRKEIWYNSDYQHLFGFKNMNIRSRERFVFYLIIDNTNLNQNSRSLFPLSWIIIAIINICMLCSKSVYLDTIEFYFNKNME